MIKKSTSEHVLVVDRCLEKMAEQGVTVEEDQVRKFPSPKKKPTPAVKPKGEKVQIQEELDLLEQEEKRNWSWSDEKFARRTAFEGKYSFKPP